MKAEKAKAKIVEQPTDKVRSIEVADIEMSELHEIEIPFREIKLELDFAS